MRSNQNLPLKQRMMIKRTILVTAAVLFVGVAAFAALSAGNWSTKKMEEKSINAKLYFDTKSLCEDKRTKEGC